MKDQNIIHRPEEGRFELEIENEIAFISYVDRSGTYFLNHSEVPIQLRNKGIGQILVSKTLAYLKEQGISYFPICSFVKRNAKKLA